MLSAPSHATQHTTPGNTTHTQAGLPQAVIDPLVDALGRSTLGRSELGMAISQAVGQVVAEKGQVVTEKLEAEKEKLEVVAEKERMEKELQVEKLEAEKEKVEVEMELRLEVSSLRGAVKDKETAILRLHGKLSLRGAIGGWVPMSVDAAA
jgi:hypothetical protein